MFLMQKHIMKKKPAHVTSTGMCCAYLVVYFNIISHEQKREKKKKLL